MVSKESPTFTPHQHSGNLSGDDNRTGNPKNVLQAPRTSARGAGFTKAYEELEQIVAAFESGDIDLERDLPKFERGLKLATLCRQRLKELENQVRRIEKTFHLSEEPAPDTGGNGENEP